jgi:hypothetical protein
MSAYQVLVRHLQSVVRCLNFKRHIPIRIRPVFPVHTVILIEAFEGSRTHCSFAMMNGSVNHFIPPITTISRPMMILMRPSGLDDLRHHRNGRRWLSKPYGNLIISRGNGGSPNPTRRRYVGALLSVPRTAWRVARGLGGVDHGRMVSVLLYGAAIWEVLPVVCMSESRRRKSWCRLTCITRSKFYERRSS